MSIYVDSLLTCQYIRRMTTGTRESRHPLYQAALDADEELSRVLRSHYTPRVAAEMRYRAAEYHDVQEAMDAKRAADAAWARVRQIHADEHAAWDSGEHRCYGPCDHPVHQGTRR